jgi:hypothetical protein
MTHRPTHNEWGCAFGYFAVIRATVVSSMRLLKPSERCGFGRPSGPKRSFASRRYVSLRRNEWGYSFGYFAVIRATVVSNMRLLKPHSLSYHDDTLTRRPETLVRVASKFEDAGLWL